ncbi:nucleotidyltransferase family protein [Candidatus Chloroploca asiatica]|uniref:nucleotidyltransferase family protein n=1 Tax=Candidatus Chloroploca asiatica TaxID=1506545 RepID=UPI001FE6CB98|nr:nucleotidyltransferase family protein [Candidatus Chloroploca asiatica]
MQALPPLQQILGTIPWVLVGGLALRAYIPERMTLDIGILIHEHDGDAARQALSNAGYQMSGPLSIGGFSLQAADPATPPLDILTRTDAWVDEALAHPIYDAAGYPVLARPYLILLKLSAGRTQDLADVQRLVAYTSEDERNAYRILVAQEAPELSEDLEALFTLADLEFGAKEEGA